MWNILLLVAMVCTVTVDEENGQGPIPILRRFRAEGSDRIRFTAPWTFIRPYWVVTAIYDTDALHGDLTRGGRTTHFVAVDCRTGVSKVVAIVRTDSIPEDIREHGIGQCRFSFSREIGSHDWNIETGRISVSNNGSTVDRMKRFVQIAPEFVNVSPRGISIGSNIERREIPLAAPIQTRGVGELWSNADRHRRISIGPFGDAKFILFEGKCDGDLDGVYSDFKVSGHSLLHPSGKLWDIENRFLLAADERLVEMSPVRTPGTENLRPVWQCIIETREMLQGRLIEFSEDPNRVNRLVDYRVPRLVLIRERQISPTLTADGSAIFLMKAEGQLVYRFNLLTKEFDATFNIEPHVLSTCIVAFDSGSFVASTFSGQIVSWKISYENVFEEVFVFDPFIRD